VNFEISDGFKTVEVNSENGGGWRGDIVKVEKIWK